MPKVKGKEELCISENKYFKSNQGWGGHALFDRYSDIENVVNKRIDSRYRHFLAEPIVEGDSITWFSKPYSETPRQLSKLQGEELAKYEQIKNTTLTHYQIVSNQLRNEGKTTEADCLANATKFVNDDFIYCFDDKTVLGIWGIQLRDDVREPFGIAVKNASFRAKKPPVVNGLDPQPEPVLDPDLPIIDEPQPEPVLDPDLPIIDEPQPEPEKTPENPFTVRFNAGENGTLNGTSEYLKFVGDTVHSNEIPEVQPKEGYEFIGWDKDPNNYRVTDDTEFTAQYREIPPTYTDIIPMDTDSGSWWQRFWCAGIGCLNWLLLLLLLAMIFMMIWCCLLNQCDFNFCACDCEEPTVIVPDSRVKPNPEPIVSPCNAQVNSGGEEGYIGYFEMGKQSGIFLFQYDTKTVPDKITIFDGKGTNGKVIYQYQGGSHGLINVDVSFNQPIITIEIIGQAPSTVWEYTINCP